MSPNSKRSRRAPGRSKVRYAVVGLGHIAQVAVLPAFRHAGNSELVALVSGDPDKLDVLGRRHRVEHLLHYDEIERLGDERLVDAVYVALPNDLHHEATLRLAGMGLHVLCEKPLATSERECREMIDACHRHRVHLMTAYRLHFDPATLGALETIRSGKLGDPRSFTSSFSMQVEDPDNIRLSARRGGGPLFDLGVYCINAARMLFEAEPLEAFAMETPGTDARFDEVPGTVAAMLRFPGDRIATFSCSFESADTSVYRVVGTKGDLLVEPAYEYAEGLEHLLTVDGKKQRKSFSKKDQFGPELVAFSEAILGASEKYPTGKEGLADVLAIEAINRSAAENRPVRVRRAEPPRRPEPGQARAFPPVRKPQEVKARSPGD